MFAVIDDFTDDFDSRLEYAKSAVYKTEEYLGEKYRQIHICGETLSRKISKVVGKELEGWGFLRKGLNPTGWIHSDSSCGGYAAVFYINDPKKESGTAFWKHKEFGENSSSCETKENINIVNGHADHEDKWDMQDLITFKQNRIVIYDADRFHSCWKRDGAPERIVQCIFMTEVR